MDEKPEREEGEKIEFSNEEGAPREAGEDIYGYKSIILTESKWAWPRSGWQMVGGWAIVIFSCIACSMLVIVLTRGWDGLLTLLGWK